MKSAGSIDRPIYMRLSCQMHHGIGSVFGKNFIERCAVSNVGLFKRIAGVLCYIRDIGQTRCISQSVHVHYRVPAAIAKRTTAEPIKPAPPVTNIFMSFGRKQTGYQNRPERELLGPYHSRSGRQTKATQYHSCPTARHLLFLARSSQCTCKRSRYRPPVYKAMRKTHWDIELVPILGCQLIALPLSIGRAAAPDVDSNIKNRSTTTAHQLALRVGAA